MALNNQEIQLKIKGVVESAQAATSLRELKQSMRELQGLTLQYGDTNQEAFAAATAEIGKAKDKIADLNGQIKAVSGEPLENVNSSIGLISNSLNGLDFGQAAAGVNALATNLKNIKFADIKSGISDLISSFAALGEAILTNPILLLGAAIVLIVMNFDKLTKAGGIVGEFFKDLGVVITALTDTIMAFINSLGIINSKQEALRENTIALKEAQDELTQAYIDGEIAIANAANQSVIALEFQKKSLAVTTARTEAEKQLHDEIIKRPAAEQILNQKSLQEANDYAKAYNIILNETQIKAIEKYYEQVNSLRQLATKQGIDIDKQNIDTEHKKNLDRINAITNQYQRERELLQENFNYDKKIRDKENAKIVQEMKDQASDEAKLAHQSYVEANDDYYKNLNIKNQLEIDYNEAKSRENSDIDKEYTAQVKKNLDNQIRNLKVFEDRKNATLEEDRKKNADRYKKSDEEQSKQQENEKNLKKKHYIDLEKLANEKALEDIGFLQKNEKELYDIENAANESNYKLGLITLKDYQDNKVKLLTQYNKEEIDRVIQSYDIQIKLAVGNATKIASLEKSKANFIKKTNKDTAYFIKQSDIDVAKHYESLTKQKEDIAKEYYAIEKAILDAKIKGEQISIDITNSEISRLDQGANKYKNVLQDKLDLLQENYANQLQINQNAMDAELLANQSNTINREEAEYQIRKKYAEKTLKLNADTTDAITAAKVQAIDKELAYLRAGLEGASLLADIAANMDEQRLKDGEKLSFAAASKQFVIKQALAAGGVIVNTAEAVMKANAASPLTGGMPWSGISIALGALQLAKIMSTKFNYSGGSSAASSGSIGSISAPSTSTAATAPTSPFYGQGTLNTINPASYLEQGQHRGTGSGDQRVYVVESDITGTQRRVEVQTQRSMLGH